AAAAVTDVTGGFSARPCWRVAGGNQQVARHLAGRLGTSVRLRSAVRSVEHDQDGVRVLTDDGDVTGDAVILAVPMAVLRALPFSPEVPRDIPVGLAAGRPGAQRQAAHAADQARSRLGRPERA